LSNVKTVSTLWAVDLVRGYLADLTLSGIELDVGVLGLPGPVSRACPGELAYPVRLYAGTAIFGPLYRVDGSSKPCARCLDRRWLALRPVEERQAIEDGTDFCLPGDDPTLPPFVLEQIAQIVLAETAAGLPEAGIGRIVELRFADLTATRHELVADSECESCSDPVADTAEAAMMPLGTRPKRTPTSYRGKDAADVPLPMGAYVNDVCGALARQIQQVYQCSATLPVSGYFRVRSKYAYHDMWWSGQSQSAASSERYGIFEGLERYAGQYPRAKQSSVNGSYAELQPDALDPASVGAYIPEFYASHADSYEPFDPDVPMPWVWGYNFTEQRPMLVPEQLVFYLDRRPEKKFVQECSSGCASGTSVDEALLHGMLELIERDAFLLCWYAGARLPEIDGSTCADEEIQFILDRVRKLGYRMRLFDMRVDIDVPAVMAVAERRDGRSKRFVLRSLRRRHTSRAWTVASPSDSPNCARWSTTTARCTSWPSTPCCTACRRWPMWRTSCWTPHRPCRWMFSTRAGWNNVRHPSTLSTMCGSSWTGSVPPAAMSSPSTRLARSRPLPASTPCPCWRRG